MSSLNNIYKQPRSMNGLISIYGDNITATNITCENLTSSDTATLQDVNINGDLDVVGLTNLQNVIINGTTETQDVNIGGDLVVSGLSEFQNIEINGTSETTGLATFHDYIDIDTIGKGIIFPDGSIQTTSSIGQGVGVVRRYLNAYSNQDQLNLSTSAYNIMSFNVTDSHNGITIVNDASGNPTKITFDKTGSYLLIISVQVKKDDAGDDDVYFWVAKNGVDIADSNTLSTLSKNGDVDLVTINFGLNIIAGDYLQWRWFSQDSNLYLHYDASQTINTVSLPATPSVIISVEETNSTYNSLQTVDISGDLFVSGNLDVSGNLNVNGNITGNWNIGDLHLTGNLTVDASANFTDVEISNDLTVDGSSNFVDVGISNDLNVINTTNLNVLNVNQINYGGDLNIQNATIANLTATIASIDTLTSTNSTITNITSENITAGQIVSTSGQINNLTSSTATIDTLNSRIGTFNNPSSSVLVETQLSYPGGVLYHDFNPMTLQPTSGWTYILYSTTGAINKNIVYNGITSFNCYYAGVGGGAGGAGGGCRNNTSPTANNTSGGSGGGGSSGLILRNTTAVVLSTGQYFNINTVGQSGAGGAGGVSNGAIAYTGNAGSAGGTTQFSTNLTGSVITYNATSGVGGYSATDGAGGFNFIRGGMGGEYFTIGSSPSIQYYGYGGGRVSGTTTNYPGGYVVGTTRSGGYGGDYYDDNLSDTPYYFSSLSNNVSFADGTTFVQEGGYNSRGLAITVNETYFGRGGGGGSGRTQKIGTTWNSFAGGRGGPGCFMLYFPTNQYTTIPNYSLSTKGFYNIGNYFTNYKSGWFAVTQNQNYTITHNLNMSIDYPLRVIVLFSNVSLPILGTNIIAQVTGQDVGNLGNPTNTAFGMQVFFTGANTLSIRTGNNGVFIDSSNIGASYGSGYYNVYVYY